MAEEKIDGMPVKDGWLMRYNQRRGEWERYMPVTEWEKRTTSIDQINAAETVEEKKQLLAAEQKDARARRRKWSKQR